MPWVRIHVARWECPEGRCEFHHPAGRCTLLQVEMEEIQDRGQQRRFCQSYTPKKEKDS